MEMENDNKDVPSKNSIDSNSDMVQPTNDVDKKQQSPSHVSVNKRRRKIIVDDDEDDDDDHDGGDTKPQSISINNDSQSIPTTSIHPSSIGSNSNHDPHDDSVEAGNASSRRRSSRSRQASVPMVEDKIAKAEAITIHDVDNDDDDGDDSVVVTSNPAGTTSKVPRKNVAQARDEAVTIDLNSLLKNKDTLMSMATHKTDRSKTSAVALKQPPNEVKPSNHGTATRNNAGSTSNTIIGPTTSTELSKEEKLRKFLATQQLQKQLQQQASPTDKTDAYRSSSGKLPPVAVLNDLKQICHQFTSQCQNKKLRLEIHPPRKGRVDLFGSFIYSDDVPTSQHYDDRYDFFDTNEKGEIIISEPPPIFPDEFPNRIPTNTAAWWGIVEPSLGIGKYKNANHPTITLASIPTAIDKKTKAMANPAGVTLNSDGTVEERMLHNRRHDASTTRQVGNDYQSNNFSQSTDRSERSSAVANIDSRQHRERYHGNNSRMEYANRDPIDSKSRIRNESQSSRNHRHR